MRVSKKRGDGANVAVLPKRQIDAIQIGLPYYFTGKPCPQGHVAPRYTKGGTCSWCTRIKAAKQQGQTFTGRSVPTVMANTVRRVAFLKGDATYVPDRPCKHGHSLRWVSSENCVECNREARHRQAERAKDRRVTKLYGLTPEAHEAMFQSQSRRCLLCETEHQHRREMHVDHCHSSGKVRGLLCSKCNQAIGLFGENVTVMLRAVEYVRADAPSLSK